MIEQRNFTEADISAFLNALDKRRSVQEDTHHQHHVFISTWINRMEKRAETMEKIKAQVGGWGIIVAISGIGVTVFEWARAHLK